MLSKLEKKLSRDFELVLNGNKKKFGTLDIITDDQRNKSFLEYFITFSYCIFCQHCLPHATKGN